MPGVEEYGVGSGGNGGHVFVRRGRLGLPAGDAVRAQAALLPERARAESFVQRDRTERL